MCQTLFVASKGGRDARAPGHRTDHGVRRQLPGACLVTRGWELCGSQAHGGSGMGWWAQSQR